MRFLIVQDHKENRRKCTLTPLEGRPGVTFLRPGAGPPGRGRLELGPGILLHLSGSPLSPSDAPLLDGEGSIILLDATWARLPVLLRRIGLAGTGPLPATLAAPRRLPEEIVTAYPRVSKIHQDPAGGLASIEALFAATAILGAPCFDLLSGYPWRERFLAMNQRLFGVVQDSAREGGRGHPR